MDPRIEFDRQLTRRHFFGRTAGGLGVAALANLLGGEATAESPTAESPTLSGQSLPHFAPKAKRVIYLFQSGGPSQLELFDYKPRPRETRKRTARVDPHGATADRHDVGPKKLPADRVELQVRPARPMRRVGERVVAAHRPEWSTTSAS